MTPPDDAPDGPDRGSGPGTHITRTLDPDYEAILAAVSETARGRWFLTEYSRRNRNADTRTLLTALNRMQSSLDRLPAPAPAIPAGPVADLRAGLADLTGTIAHLRAEIAAVPRYGDEGAIRRGAGDVDLPGESEIGKTAVRQAHESAERIQEIVWNLRERSVSSELCDLLDRHAVDIQAACRNGTVALKGMDAMGRGLHVIEQRLAALAGSLSDLPDPRGTTPDAAGRFADDPAIGRFLDDVSTLDADDVDWQAVAPQAETPDDDSGAARGEAESSGEFRAAGSDGEPEPAAPDGPAAAAVTRLPETDRAADRNRQPPPDLTGLTFDQKMILFS